MSAKTRNVVRSCGILLVAVFQTYFVIGLGFDIYFMIQLCFTSLRFDFDSILIILDIYQVQNIFSSKTNYQLM